MSNPVLNPPPAAEPKPAAAPAAQNGSADKSAGNGDDQSPKGLSSDEAGIRLKKFGANSMPDTSAHPLRSAFSKFWTPVPLMLEAAIVLEVVLGKYVEAAVIMALLVFNAALGFFQEVARASDSRGAEVAPRAERVGPARRSMEDHARGRIGARRYREAVAWRRGRGRRAHRSRARSCSISRCSPANRYRSKAPRACRRMPARWCAAARRSRKSRRPARAPSLDAPPNWSAPLTSTSSEQKAVLRVVRNLAMFNGVVIVMLVGVCLPARDAAAEIMPLVLTAILASIPVALPATFTLAAALGARALAASVCCRRGFPPSMKPQPSTSCAPTRPAR